MRRIIGYLLLFAPAIAWVIFAVMQTGIILTVVILATIILMFLVAMIGVYLIGNEKAEREYR